MQAGNVPRPRQKSLQSPWPAALRLKGSAIFFSNFSNVQSVSAIWKQLTFLFEGLGNLHHPLLCRRTCKRTISSKVAAGGRRPSPNGWRFHTQQVVGDDAKDDNFEIQRGDFGWVFFFTNIFCHLIPPLPIPTNFQNRPPSFVPSKLKPKRPTKSGANSWSHQRKHKRIIWRKKCKQCDPAKAG